MNNEELKEFLDLKHDQYNRPSFVAEDPISIPHQFTKKEDIEIASFVVATISWGKRNLIIRSGNRIMDIMEHSPYCFVMNYDSKEQFAQVRDFKHRTFNGVDLDYFIRALQNIYRNHGGLEPAFSLGGGKGLDAKITEFRKVFFEVEAASEPNRTVKHVSNPEKNSSTKRICMFLRWMVRKDNRGVDFGLWDSINPADLKMPLDVHTGNVGRALGILQRPQDDWKAVTELTSALCSFDPADPVKYDFALFGLGRYEGF